MYKIESGVSVPNRKGEMGSKYPFNDMKVGDSFLHPEYSSQISMRMHSAIYNYRHKQLWESYRILIRNFVHAEKVIKPEYLELNNKTMKEKLIKVSTYARENKLSLTTVYNQIKDGTLKSKVIDGVTFVQIN